MSNLSLGSLLSLENLDNHFEEIRCCLLEQKPTDNPLMANATERILSSNGKLLRSCLAIAASGSGGKKLSQQLLLACTSVELAHCATLVHDDIIDDSPRRRGVRTINSEEGVDQAIVIGDYLLVQSTHQATQASPKISLALSEAIARVCVGQSLELKDRYNPGRSIDDYLKSIDGKTASLISAACKIGGLCADANPKELAALEEFGHNFGMAYQILDDLLDLLAEPGKLGKPVGSDIHEGVYTLPVILGLHGQKAEQIKLILESQEMTPRLIEILKNDASIERTLEYINNYNQKACNSLSGLAKKTNFARLAELPDKYSTWAMRNLINTKL